MSYILDALRKSDQQRRQGLAPGLMAVDDATLEEKPRKFSWLAAVALLMFVTGIAIGWWQPWQAAPQSASAPVTAMPQVHPEAVSPNASSSVSAVQTVPPQTPPVPARAESLPHQPMPAKPAAMALQETRPAPDENAESIPQSSIVKRDELPAEVRAGLPNISVSLHAYSSKSDNRMVIVNGKTLQEGETLAPGLILERITPQDMVFGYKGYRFRQSVQ